MVMAQAMSQPSMRNRCRFFSFGQALTMTITSLPILPTRSITKAKCASSRLWRTSSAISTRATSDQLTQWRRANRKGAQPVSGFISARFRTTRTRLMGLKLDGVRDDSPAAKAGLRAGDKIVKMAGREVKNVYDYTYALGEMKAGQVYEVEIVRGSERLTFKITPAATK